MSQESLDPNHYSLTPIRMSKNPLLIIIMLCSLWIPCIAQNNPKNDIKITLLSLGSGSTRITYERALSTHNSAELTLGFVGLGWDIMNDADPKGLLVKAAYKWNILPLHDMALAGLYVKPEFVYANFDYTDLEQSIVTTQHVNHWALLAEVGYQIIYKWFLFDIYTGLGPSNGDVATNNYYHSFMLFPSDGHLAFTAGFRIGVAF